MAANIQYFGDRLDFISRKGNGVRVFSNDQHLDASHVEKLAVAICEICYVLDHSINMYPIFQDDLSAPINTFGVFQSCIKYGMTLIQTCMIKNSGTTLTLIMQQGQHVLNININSNNHINVMHVF